MIVWYQNDVEGSFPDRINKCGDLTYNKRSYKELDKIPSGVLGQEPEN